MKFFTHGRYVNFFGQREARLSTDQSVFKDDRKKRTWLITIMSVLLFFAPEAHLKALNIVYTDFVVCRHRWSKFIHKVQNEWRELGRIGTVLLTANVAFLAIPSVDTPPSATSSATTDPLGSLGNSISPGGGTRTPAQVTSYMSIIFSLGTLAIGQLLLRHHMARPQDSAEEVDRYLRDHHDTNRGLETLAILYSLPYSLLLWAITSFFVAFVFVALVDLEGKWQRYPTAVVMFVFVALLVWCVHTTSEGPADFVERIHRFLASSSTSGKGKFAPVRPDKGPSDGQDTPRLQSVHTDHNNRSS